MTRHKIPSVTLLRAEGDYPVPEQACQLRDGADLHIVTATPSAVRTPAVITPPAGAALADVAATSAATPAPSSVPVQTLRGGVDLDPLMVALERLGAGWWLPCRWVDVWKASRL